MAVTSILESGLYFEPGPHSWFRFDACKSFQPLKGNGVCEMDFGWYEADRKTQWLLELRDYSASGKPVDLAQPDSRAFLIQEFAQKAKDSLLLLGSLWHDLPCAEVLRRDLPAAFHQMPSAQERLKLVFVVKTDTPTSFQSAAQPLKDSLTNRLKGQSHLLGVLGCCDVLLLDHQTAIAAKLPLREGPAPPANKRGTKAGR